MPNSITTSIEIFVAYGQTYCQYLTRAADGILEPIDPQPTVYRAQYISSEENTQQHISSIRLSLSQNPPTRLLCILNPQVGIYPTARYFHLASGALTEEKYRVPSGSIRRIQAHQYFVVTGDSNPWDEDFRIKRKGYFVTSNNILAVRKVDQDAFKSPIFTLDEETDEHPKEVEKEVDLDPVTKIPSRRQMDLDLGNVFSKSTERKSPLALLVVDLDNFKQINSEVGHSGGDEALHAVAQKLLQCVEHKGMVYRYSVGDELVVVLPNYEMDEAMAVAERIRKGVEQLSHPGSTKLTVTIGLATYPDPIDMPQKLFEAADKQLMAGKKKEKNRIYSAS